MPVPSNLVKQRQGMPLGSAQSVLRSLSQDLNYITNANAILADGANLVSATKPTETGTASANLISASGARWVYERDALLNDALCFSMGHTADASAKTATIRVCGWNPLVVKNRTHWRGRFLFSATLTGGNQSDANSLLLPDGLQGAAGVALSFNHVAGIAIVTDKTYRQNVKVCSDAANGIAEVVFDPGSLALITVEASVGASASCLAGCVRQF